MLTLVEQVVWTLRVTSQTPNIWMMAMIVVKMMRIVQVMVMIEMVTYDEIGDDGEGNDDETGTQGHDCNSKH